MVESFSIPSSRTQPRTLQTCVWKPVGVGTCLQCQLCLLSNGIREPAPTLQTLQCQAGPMPLWGNMKHHLKVKPQMKGNC